MSQVAVTTAQTGRAARPHRHEQVGALLLALPYILIFLFLLAYPLAKGFELGSDLQGYKRLLRDSIYVQTLRNTLIFIVIGVNLKLFLALILSGFFTISSRWVKFVSLIFILPWAMPAIPTILSFRLMLNTEWGMVNHILGVFGEGPVKWLSTPSLALGTAIFIHIWKWLPFWTLILLAGRMAISKDIYEAAAIDGAAGLKRFAYVTFPQLRNLYLTSTILSMIWTLGDFNSIYLLTGGGPIDSTHVLSTLAFRYAFTDSDLKAGMSATMTALPFVIPMAIFLVSRLQKGENA